MSWMHRAPPGPRRAYVPPPPPPAVRQRRDLTRWMWSAITLALAAFAAIGLFIFK